MDEVKPTRIDESSLDRLLGIESSKIGYYAEVKQKIRELEIANSNLRAKKSELQAVFDSISDGVVIYNSAGCIQHRNHICPRLFPEQTMPGKACRELFHPEQESAREQCPVEIALHGESCQISFTNNSSGGENRYFDVTASPICRCTRTDPRPGFSTRCHRAQGSGTATGSGRKNVEHRHACRRSCP
jgi:two-component system, NtrC family, sensor kinase